jgi:hypothetical protein
MIPSSEQTRAGNPWPPLWVAAAACTVAALLVFVLPFAVPVPLVHTISASYIAGFNNRVAILAAAGLGALVLLWRWWRAPSAPTVVDEEAKLTGRTVAIAIVATCLFTAFAGWLVARSHLRYLADAGYIMEQLEAHGDYGRALYTQLEFAYGPLLFYPASIVHSLLRCSWHVAYFITLALNQAVGVLLLAYSMNALPMRARDRRIAFVLLVAGAVNPLLGLNYTFFRFLTPLATFLFATRSPSLLRTAILLAAGEVLQLGISPEMGFIFVFASIVFTGLAVWKRGLRWLVVIAAPPVGVGVFRLLAGPSYLKMLQSLAHGALNLPVAPYPHILVFLFALVWLVPMALGPRLRASGDDGIRIVSCYILSIALLPAAFGRCDPLHVFFNGAGILILSLVAMRDARPRLRNAWLAALFVVVSWEHWVNDRLSEDRTADTVRLALTHTVHPDDEDYVLDMPGLEREVGGAPVAIPSEVSLPVEESLKRARHYQPDYYAFFVDVMDPVAEAAKAAGLNQFQWALLPTDPDDPFIETPADIDGVQGFAFPYPARNPVPYEPGHIFSANLQENWRPVRAFGPYTLYHRVR